jgi:ketosteroid isomerase-like protein
MTEVIDRLAVAVNAHDLDAAAGFFDEDYRSEQPAHPGRAFTRRAQMRANWEAMFAGIPDFHAEIRRSVQDGETTWTEWLWSGTRSDGQAFEVRGVTLFEIADGQIAAGRLYLEDVERDVSGIEQAVKALSGRRPRPRRRIRASGRRDWIRGGRGRHRGQSASGALRETAPLRVLSGGKAKCGQDRFQARVADRIQLWLVPAAAPKDGVLAVANSSLITGRVQRTEALETQGLQVLYRRPALLWS